MTKSLSFDEKLELELLLKKQRLYCLPEDVNPNYKFIFNALRDQKYNLRDELINGYRGVILEGSSRSGKTWSAIFLIMYICLFKEENCTINIYRETFESFKTTLYRDFKNVLDFFDLPNKFHNAERINSFKIGNNLINFIGCDKVSKAHGAGCDYAFFNEMIYVPKAIFDQVEMRCQKFWIGDYNPSVTQHYIFSNIITRSDIGFLRTTFRDNPHVSRQERIKILSSEPWESGSYTVEDNKIMYKGKEVTKDHQPPPHVKNIAENTADEFYWKVYGLGLRGAMKGVIFNNIEWIKEFPEDLQPIYPNDFGFTTDPNALVKYAEDDKNIFIEPLSYEPIETPEDLDLFFRAVNVPLDAIIPCDSSDRFVSEKKGVVQMVDGLNDLGYENAFKISKTKSVMYWLNSMKRKKIHIVINGLFKEVKAEAEMYKMKEIAGVAINQPIDKYNHIWDSARYGHMAWNNPEQIFKAPKNFNDLGVNY